MKDWKTTLIGLAAAILFIGYKMKKGAPIEFTDITLALGLLGVGAASKDSSTHSTEAEVARSTEKALDNAVPPDGTTKAAPDSTER